MLRKLSVSVIVAVLGLSLPAMAQEDYSGQTLRDVNFLGQDLAGADFSGATLNGVVFANANLQGAKFNNASLGSGDKGATDFSLANLSAADFSDVTLTSVISFQHATITGAQFKGMDLSNAYFGPSLDAKIPAPKSGGFKSVGNIIQVAATGGVDSATCGLPKQSACATINAGIHSCRAAGAPCTVQIGYGKYALTSPLVLVDGVSLQGGIVAGKPTSYQSTITAPPGGDPVIKAGAGMTATLSSLILMGSVPINSYTASNVVQVVGTDGISLDTLNIYAATGAAASTQPAQGGAAFNGFAGHAWNDATSPSIGGESLCKTNTAGGHGGVDAVMVSSCQLPASIGAQCTCTLASGSAVGGAGGAGQSAGGAATSPPFPNGADLCFVQSYVNGQAVRLIQTTARATNGSNGADANVAAGPSPNQIGAFSAAGEWSPTPGTVGTAGADAGGGGGGGIGQPLLFLEDAGSVFAVLGPIVQGLNGGGGGSGGCGATGGGGGVMGGATFGIVALNSKLNIVQSLKIVGAQGGRGGPGGPGASGGTAGAGGAGCGNSCWAKVYATQIGIPSSGAGGSGGTGGASGGGAGGNGGPSVGVVLLGTSTFDQGPSSIYPGASGTAGDGGPGLTSPATPAGTKGSPGLAQAVYSVSN